MAVLSPEQTKPVEQSKAFDGESVAALLKEGVDGAVVSASSAGIVVQNDKLIATLQWLKQSPDLAYDYFNSVTAVDWPDKFEVVYHVSSTSRGGPPLALKVNLNDKENPVVDSAGSVYYGAIQQEREAYDFFGVKFAGHPNLRRIFMWEGFEGYPLRKSYKEAYYEQDRKPFETRWDQGHHIIIEDRVPWHDNVIYPKDFDPTTYKQIREIVRVAPNINEGDVKALKTQPVVVSIGPQHPSTHGVFRMNVTLDGETVMALEPIFGYLHRNHEKIGERNMYIMNTPFTDRLDYLSGMCMETGYVIGVEKLMGVKPPERAEYLRVIMNEFTRIVSHMFGGIGQVYSDLGAFFTPIVIYGLEERELIIDLFEAASGSRMMCNYMRFGGVWRDVPEGWLDIARELVDNRLPKVADEMEKYLVHNEIFDIRAKNIGVLPADLAVSYGVSGPMLRASGVKYDLRRADPYSIYDRFDFDVPVGANGDIYDRMFLRIKEIRESIKILRQALRDIPNGETMSIKKAYSFKVPKGEVYAHIEAPRGEFGWYLVSDNTTTPYRYHVRAGDFVNLATMEQMCVGHKIGDLVGVLGSVDIIMGSVDR
ncbi:MAG: NADH-quinone oxidoreductase subunit D [Chloroflexi bacterium]|nr:MAG: NADH-quinone oxidoreductase subunit D [Chloroflexota bacterium]